MTGQQRSGTYSTRITWRDERRPTAIGECEKHGVDLMANNDVTRPRCHCGKAMVAWEVVEADDREAIAAGDERYYGEES